jgi:hypothetical protein
MVVCWCVVRGMWNVACDMLVCGCVECDMWYVDMLVVICGTWYMVRGYGYVGM